MSWRTVYITQQCKLSYRNGNLIIRNENTTMIHLSEIHIIIVEDTTVSLTTYLISELLKQKIKLIFCDERRNPQGELIPYYGSHNSSKKFIIKFYGIKDIKNMFGLVSYIVRSAIR